MKTFSQCRGVHGGTNKFKQAPNAVIIQQTLTGSGSSNNESKYLFNYEWDGNTEGKEKLAIVGAFSFYLISPDILSQDELLGANAKTYYDSQGGEFIIVQTSAGNLLVGYGSIDNGILPTIFIGNTKGDDSFSGINFTVEATGIWFLHSTGEQEYTHYLRKDKTI